jgi:hypothetical protein
MAKKPSPTASKITSNMGCSLHYGLVPHLIRRNAHGLDPDQTSNQGAGAALQAADTCP